MIRYGLSVIFAAGVAMHFGAAPPAIAATPEDAWPALAEDVFKGRPLADGSGIVAIEMPARAEDAAIVPVTLRVTLPQGDARHLKTMTLVIDDNPAPVAATFKIADNAGISAISTRVRVNSYTNVHAVAELSDGQLYMVKTYVKASGGCAAPAAKNARADEIPPVRKINGRSCERAARSADHDPSPEQFGAAARSGLAALHSGLLRG